MAVNRGEILNTINLTAYQVLELHSDKNKRLELYLLIARLSLCVCKTRKISPKIIKTKFSLILAHYDTPRTNT